MTLFRKGEVVTCTNGCRVAVVNQDIEPDSTAKVEHFDWEIDPAPRAREQITKCGCGGYYVASTGPKRMSLHLGGAWRPKLPPGIIFD